VIYSYTEFITLFLATALLLRAGGVTWRRIVLLVASMIFLYWAGWPTVLIMLGVVTLTWTAANLASRDSRAATAAITICVVLFIVNLFVWKYWGWVRSELGITAGDSIGDTVTELGLPIGISFYTLQAVAYLIEIRRGVAPAGRIKFMDVLLFQCFFGQLIAGPIVRYGQLMPQLQNPRSASAAAIVRGLELFALGYFKKLVLADRAAHYVDPVFGQMSEHDGATILCALILYSVQIWADFSGYIDMGRGAARVCGINLPQNFRSPYLSQSPSDFWRRWNITLGTWLRDFLYIPLGGSRGGVARTVFNLLLTMLVCGLWHGAAWWFVLWGLYHGCLLAVQRAWRSLIKVRIPISIAVPLTLIAVSFGWLFFRVESLSDIGHAIDAFLAIGPDQFSYLSQTRPTTVAAAIVFPAIALFIQYAEARPAWRRAIIRSVNPMLRGGAVGVLICVAIALRGNPVPFIYFQF
jgi:alginate O-acetyltransferase complex protein AlgI